MMMGRNNKEYFVNLRKKRKRDGICQVCGGKAVANKVFCEKCLDKNALKRRQWRRNRIKRGVCTMCGKRKPTKSRKACSVCTSTLSDSHKSRKTKRKVAGVCIQCGKEKAVKGTQQCGICADKNRSRQIRARAERRRIVLQAYGSKCVCCGEMEVDFLEIDHVRNDGAEHRRSNVGNIDTWAIRHDFPPSLQLLCANCNRSKEKHGKCIHEIRKEREEDIDG
jgi:hypothetical protein